jgi:hypothetical protein
MPSDRSALALVAVALIGLLFGMRLVSWKSEHEFRDTHTSMKSTNALRLVHSPTDVLALRAVDQDTGAPITQYKVMLEPWDAPRTADERSRANVKTIGPALSRSASGLFRLKGPPAGEWRLTIRAMEHEPFEAKLLVAEDATRTTASLPLRRGRTITGRVYDAANGSGIRGATVMLRDVTRLGSHWRTPRSVQTTREGWFSVDGVPLGALRVDLEAEGYAPREFDWSPTGEPAQQLEISLTSATLR